MFPNIVICYEEAAIEVKTMAEGILAVTVFCMFGLGFYIANKADQILGRNSGKYGRKTAVIEDIVFEYSFR